MTALRLVRGVNRPSRRPARGVAGVAWVGLLAAFVAQGCAAAPRGAEPRPDARRSPAAASGPRVRRPYVSPPSRALDWIRSLATEVGPRLAGSPGDRLAVEWAVRAMQQAGLVNVHTEPVRATHWDRGVETAEIVSPGRRVVALAALGGSVGTPPGGIEADVVEFADLDALSHAAPGSLEGRIAFVDQHMQRARDGSGYGTAVVVRIRGAVAAARAGALAIVIRSVGTDQQRVPHTGALRYADEVRRIPAAAISNPDADVLHGLLSTGHPARMRIALGARTLPDAETANVVGEVRGAVHPEQIVLLGAHLDSWDLGMGAIDDGAGCAIILEAARRLHDSGRVPARTVRVVMFANEENGLAGARAYGEAHREELSAHIVAMEADAGDGHVFGVRYRGAPEARPLFERVARSLRRLGVTIDGESAHGGADLIPLVAARVPVIDLRQDMSTYFDIHHTANDTPAVVRVDEIDQAVDAFARITRALANMDGDFGRAPAEPERH